MQDSQLTEQLEAELHVTEHMIEECRNAGKQSNFGKLVSQAKDALNALETMEVRLAERLSDLDGADDSIRSLLLRTELLTVSALGYMGFGLMKQFQYDEALPPLKLSIERNHAIEANASTSKRRHRELIAAEQAYKFCQEQLSRAQDMPLIKYPRTAHLFDTGGAATTPDDLVLSEKDAAYTALCDGHTNVVIEEKLDGANLGISFDPLTQEFLVQNRSHFISSGEHAQFSRITEFIEEHRAALHRILYTSDYQQSGCRILYGEWLAACHSVPYHKLPGIFVAYDVFDRSQEKFFSRKRFHTVMKGSGIPVAPVISTRSFGPYTQRQKRDGIFRLELVNYLDTMSAFRNDDGTVEGIVLRVDDPESLWNQLRYKIVRPDFVQGCNSGHWLSRSIEKQRVDFAFANEYINECCVFADTSDESNVPKEDTKNSSDNRRCRKSAANVTRETREYEAQRARARRRVPPCVMLVGLPGAGKSTFANRLAASAPDEWVVVNQDRLGKKKCIELAGKASRKSRVILDRCHPTVAERREWHDTVGSPSKGDSALVYFTASVDTCTERVKNRTSHETIPEGRGERIVKCVAKMLEPPSKSDEDLFGTIEVVNSFKDSDALLYKWGVDSVEIR